MGRLHIKCLELQPDGDYALRFSGHQPDFLAMIEDLKYERCRWDPDACSDNKGGWIVDAQTLMDFVEQDRFDNAWQLIHQEEERREREERRRMNAISDKVLREMGYLDDIEDCPF